MKNFLTIIFRLTLSCLVAGLIMGTTFVLTNKAKKANEHAREQKVVYALLGYTGDQQIPESMAMHELYRFVVTDGTGQSIGYLLPTGEHGQDGGFSFIRIGLDGSYINHTPVSISEENVRDQGERDKAIGAALGADKTIRFTDQTIVVTDHGKRTAYLLSGKFPGFKTNIAIILALAPDYSVIGLEIMEHEEDPGLGAEIEQDYFKNQFKYKPFEKIKSIEVVKEPIPDQYYAALEGNVDEAAAVDIMQQYRDQDIYALTGATISSVAVSSGVKSMTRKFAYRLDLLDNVLEQQQIAVPF
jgi:electron transport complex protein RnfG